MAEEENLTKKEKRELRRQERNVESDRRQKMRVYKRVMVWAVAVFVVAGSIFGIFWLLGSPGGERVFVGAVLQDDQIKGNSDAGTTIIEYSDFQCQACAAYYPIIKRLAEEYGDSAIFVYRHFPLRQIHPNAELAAQASESAARQGKFWEMHDMLFENQQIWSNQRNPEETFIGYASAIGLDVEKFKSDLASEEVENKVDRDYNSAISAGINATPTFIFNGEKIQTPRTYEQFRTLIEQSVGSDR
ncbi:MAG: hypothetical protein COU46_03235 [Candidatus Niyogibacteria bacterium CG10_big_fil_rev_8_21_14_0_10_42_19]|uniref:Thioredoxin domain-containing protein n=1 Tax=Candidatus Niyogibacteria bacterium CG10_big_fil_rev_8_21_14_0_10_42_19 TaxID=1974725 RepID=A0A2H0TF10_9BACT|nr:MAG: hypothetical protein COU46_03235 [Candidatus Niyogibacteria bacterium CG10_big_fil_rev_8_21_14_0_10_42_19]